MEKDAASEDEAKEDKAEKSSKSESEKSSVESEDEGNFLKFYKFCIMKQMITKIIVTVHIN